MSSYENKNNGAIGERQATSWDANNNSGVKQEAVCQNLNLVNIGRTQADSIDIHKMKDSTPDLTMNKTEDWHLLDVDEQQLSNITNFKENAKTKSEKTKANNKYIEIDPLGPTQKRYSPKLIYLCTALYSVLPLASVILTFLLIALIFSRFYYIPMLYFAHIVWNRNACNRGGQRVDFIYKSKFWSYLAAYFPIKMRYTKEFKLNPNENYILNYHPHGISAFGAVTAFATNGLKFNELFPGITTRFMVHETSFVIPIMRETFAFRGDCSVNSRSIDYMLSSKSRTDGKAGNLLTIVVGGLAEADLSNAEVLKIVVAERKGFVKKALIHGAHIIPCIAFGENSVFKKVDLKSGSLLHRLESRWYKLFKFKHPIYYGHSLLSDKMKGVMPYKRPITVVMGDPIHVERIENPGQQDIDHLHTKYLTHLRSMYEANNDLCSKYDKTMELI